MQVFARDSAAALPRTLVFFALDNQIGRVDAAIFPTIHLVYVVFAARSDREGMEHRSRDFLKFVFDFEHAPPLAQRLAGLRSNGLADQSEPGCLRGRRLCGLPDRGLPAGVGMTRGDAAAERRPRVPRDAPG